MKPVYEIKFLGSKDFDKLPKAETNGADISDSLGFYNPFTNRVFIRHTAIPELDKYLLQHEFDHLLEDKPTDEDEFGIRHKKKRGFMDWFTGLSTAGMWKPHGGAIQTQNQQNDEQMAQSQQQGMQQEQFNSMFSNPLSMSSQQGSPLGGQQSGQSSLGQGLNSQTVNPLANPYDKYGQQAGRLSF